MTDPIGGDPPNIPPAPPAPAAPAERKKYTCEFCGCVCAPDGSVLEMSDKSRKFRDLAEDNKKLEAEIATLRSENATLRAANPNPAPTPKVKAGLKI